MKIFDKELFKKIRKEKKCSQQEIADVLHINRSYISQWESGSVTPSQEQVQQLEEYLNVSLYKQEKAQWLSELQTNLLDPLLLIFIAYKCYGYSYSFFSVIVSIGAMVFAWKRKLSYPWIVFTICSLIFILRFYIGIKYGCFDYSWVYYKVS